jgi:hypothetical protein
MALLVSSFISGSVSGNLESVHIMARQFPVWRVRHRAHSFDPCWVVTGLLWVITKLAGIISESDLSEDVKHVCHRNEFRDAFIYPTFFLVTQALYLLTGLTSSS